MAGLIAFTYMISTDNISTVPYLIVQSMCKIDNIFEMRLLAWVLAKAQAVIKLYNKDLSEINLAHALNLVRVTLPARYLLADGDNNYRNIKKAFALAEKTIPFQQGKTIYHLNIIAMPELKKDGHNTTITFVIHNLFWHAALEFTKGYRLVNLPTMLRLKSTYSVILYMLISEHKQPLTYALPTLRELLRANSQSYDRSFNFAHKVLDAAKKELDAVAPWSFTYQLAAQGRGRAITHVSITPHRNDGFTMPAPTEREQDLFCQRLRIDDRVTAYMREAFDMTAKDIEKCEGYICQLGTWQQQIDHLTRIRQYVNTRNVRNVAAYVTASVQRAHA